MGELQAAGDVVSGALLGRALEPHAGEGDGGHGGMCLNCGTALIGPHCHQCGQSGHVHRTLTSIGHDLLHGVFHFEGKIWNTLPMLVTHPGSLTRRYIDGERARFVSPLALFLFSVFLMFATFHSLGDGESGTNRAAPARSQQRVAKLDEQISKARTQLADAQARKAKGGAGAEGAGDDIESAQAELTALNLAKRTIAAGADGQSSVTLEHHQIGWRVLDRAVEHIKGNPELALYKLQSSAYKYSWALIPISVPFVAMLFLWRRRFKLYDHAIFVTYSLSFMTLLIALIMFLAIVQAPGWIWGSLLVFAPPVHMFYQLRGAYQLRTFSALWRTCALLVFSSITLTLFALLLFALGLMD